MDVGHEQAYRDGYRFVRSLVEPLDEQQLGQTCPHCPEWSLKDVLAHLMAVQELTVTAERPSWLRSRVIASIVNSDLVDRAAAGVERDTFWNDRVASLRVLGLDELFVRWDTALEQLSPEQWSVVDFAVHVGDLEEALGTPQSTSMELHALSLERYGQLQLAHLEASGVSTVSLSATDAEVLFGDASAEHRVHGTTYELLRVVTGRRTLTEAEHLLDWTTTPPDTRAVFPIYDWLTQSRQHQRAF